MNGVEKDMRDHLNDWVVIRHTVALGILLPNTIQWLKDPQNRPLLTPTLLRECKRFFEHVEDQTDDAFRLWLQNHHGVSVPW